MTLHLKSRGYPFRPRLLFSCFIVVGVGFPNCVLFQERTELSDFLDSPVDEPFRYYVSTLGKHGPRFCTSGRCLG